MWEYRVLTLDPRQLQEKLTALGAQGWELFSVETLPDGTGIVTVCVLRRESE